MLKVHCRLELNLRHQADCPRVAGENRPGVQEVRIRGVQERASGCISRIPERPDIVNQPGDVLRVIEQVLEVRTKLEVHVLPYIEALDNGHARLSQQYAILNIGQREYTKFGI
jgi:hypothetical protein